MNAHLPIMILSRLATLDFHSSEVQRDSNDKSDARRGPRPDSEARG